MENVTGRVADFLIKKDGSRVAGVSLIENTLTKIPGIAQMQIVQESIEKIRLNIVPDECFRENTSEQLISYFGDLFGKGVSIEINPVEEIKPGKSGEYRFSICKVGT